MGKYKRKNEQIQDYYNLSLNYLKSAKLSIEKRLFEPAMFSAIHALELSLKAALLEKTDIAWKTHNIGGQFGKFFVDKFGDKTCRRINIIISKYNLPRYPGQRELEVEEVKDDIFFIEEFITHKIIVLLK